MKKILCVIVLLLSTPLYLFGQLKDAKSAFKYIQSANSDTQKINRMNEAAYFFSLSAPDSQLKYTKLSLSLSEKIDYKRGLARGYKNLGIYYSVKGDKEKAFEQFAKYLNYATMLADQKEIADVYLDYCVTYYRFYEFEKSDMYANKALSIYMEINDIPSIVDIYIQKSSALFYLNKPVESAAAAAEGLKLAESIKDSVKSSICYVNLALSYLNLKNYDKTIEYSMKSVGYLKKAKDYNNLSTVYSNIANSYEEKKNFDEALKFRKLAYETAVLTKDTLSIRGAEGGLAFVYYLKKNYTLALEYLDKALDYLPKTNDIVYKIGTYEAAAKIYNAVNNYELAKKYAKLNLEIASDPAYIKFRVSSYEVLSDVYGKTGDYKNSLEYHKLFKAAYDSVFNEDLSHKLIELQTKYETERTEKELSLLKDQQELKNIVIQKQRYLIVLISAALVLLSVLAFFLIRSNKNRKRINAILNKQNLEIEEYAGRMKELNATKDKIFSIIAHDLKNPFQAILGISTILKDDLDSLSKERKDGFLISLHDTAKRANSLLENLLQWSRSQRGKLQYEPVPLNLKDMIEHSLQLLGTNADSKKIKISVNVNEACSVKADCNMMDTIIRNLLGNAIKFTFENGMIEFLAKENGEMVVVQVKDNGMGIPEDVQKKIFELGSVQSTNGTNQEKGSGLGLVLCREFIEKQGGKLWLESKPGEGTSFYFSVPKYI